MKKSIYLLIITTFFFSCTNNKSANNNQEEKTATSNVDKNEQVTEVSYERLKELLDKNEAISVNYLVSDKELPPQKALYENRIVQESNSYILIQSRDDGTDAKNYYLLTFSKKTGQLISFIGIGQEAEGVDPYKINWQSDKAFSTVDYQYEIVEDKESGAYIQGALQDSTLRNYEITEEGIIKEITK